MKSTVRVLGDKKDAALGTIVTADGFILTKYSEVANAKVVACKLPDGKTLEAKVVGVNDKFDLAMLKVEAKDLTPVKFSDSKIARVGNWIASAGTSDDPVAVGVMSVASRTLGRDNFIDPRNPKRGFWAFRWSWRPATSRASNSRKSRGEDRPIRLV